MAADGNVYERGDASGGPGKSSLFFLTVLFSSGTLESTYSAKGFRAWESGAIFAPSGALPTALENTVA